MAEVVTFENFTPSPRFDAVPWEFARIEESATEDGTWTTIDTITLSPVDPDPTDPASRDFTTPNGTGSSLWYRVVFVDGVGGESQPTTPLHNTPSPPPISETAYATTAELARRLKLRAPSAEQIASMELCLSAAALEINAELDRSEPFGDPPPNLVVLVNLERAEQYWMQTEVPLNVVGLGSDSVPLALTSNSWLQFAHKLAPLKEGFGIG